MCTVSYYSNPSETIITSNRDEKTERPKALSPKVYKHKGTYIFYPKDPLAGGTWFVVKFNGDVIVLLNGAKQTHAKNPPYRKSRGLVILEIAIENNILNAWFRINLMDIEPFTLVLYSNAELHQLRWNGVKKSEKSLDHNGSYIWSSSTLYTETTIKNRERWFREFLNNTNRITNKDLLKFHTETNLYDKENGLVINRNDHYKTKNISQCVITKTGYRFIHEDLIKNKTSNFNMTYNENFLA